MLRTLFWVTWMFLYLLTRLPLYWKAKRLMKQGRLEKKDVIVQQQVKRWTSRLVRHIKMTMEISGTENLPGPDETVVFAANHQSFLDVPVLLCGLDRPYALLARKEIGKVPLLRGWMDMLGCIYLDREDMRAAMHAMKEAEEWLRAGNSIIVFPEGTRAKTDALGEFKAGVVRMAVKANVRIVPVMIDGTGQALERNGFKLRKANVRFAILPPVETKGLSREEQRELPGKLEAMISKAMAEK